MGTATDAIGAARDRLRTARFGQSDMAVPERSRSGLMNAIVFGRMATFQLQNMSSTEPDFKHWWESHRSAMKQDAIMQACCDLRTEIEKKSTSSALIEGVAINYNSVRDNILWGNPPPNVIGKFLGNHLGQSGWTIMAEDGSHLQYVVDIPSSIVTKAHGVVVGDDMIDAGVVVEYYLSQLECIVDSAAEKFL